MREILEFVTHYSYLVIFFGVLLEQLGVPFPSMLLLLAAGALGGLGKLHLGMALFLAVLAATMGDTVWFTIGRWRGFRVLGLLCRISLEPDSCVSGAKQLFFRHGAYSLLVTKFIPGISTFAQPLAGATGMPIARFVIFDGLGILLWASVPLSLGYIFRNQLEEVAAAINKLGGWFATVIGLTLFGYLVWKFIARQRFLRSLRVARIAPEELKQRLDQGEDVMIVDLRGTHDFDANPQLIPTALRLAAERLAEDHTALPRDRDIVLYCTCPNEATSARLTLQLNKYGITRVRPLAGGLQGWQELNFPLQMLETDSYITPK